MRTTDGKTILRSEIIDPKSEDTLDARRFGGP